MPFFAEYRTGSQPWDRSFQRFLEEIKGPACLVADDGKTVLSVNRKAIAILETLSPDDFVRGMISGTEEEPLSGADLPCPFPASRLSILSESQGAPGMWSLMLEGQECTLYVYPAGERDSLRGEGDALSAKPGSSRCVVERELQGLETVWEQTIELLAGVTELRDPYTMGHQRRVAHLAGALARELGLGEEKVREVVRAGLVHDIGKIQIPAEFLSKPGKLGEKEFAIIREHPNTGGDLLKGIELPWPLSAIVLQHHERMDGSGYPRGLKGEDILPAARVIAVADVVEAMASHRPYRPALGIERALREVTTNAGRLYDADVVAACRRLFLERGYSLPLV